MWYRSRAAGKVHSGNPANKDVENCNAAVGSIIVTAVPKPELWHGGTMTGPTS